VERRTGIVRQFAGCFTDHRNPVFIEHSVLELVGQRVYGLALGYEDLNDHDELRRDPLLATLVGKVDPTGARRLRDRDVGKALAGKSTLNRLELTRADAGPASRYKKIVIDGAAVDRLFVQVFLQAFRKAPRQIVLDLDATDDPLHGEQEGRFFHGFYGNYCYLPLYIFCGEFLLCARLRRSNIDASAGTVDELQRIVAQIRAAWPGGRISIRADSGFAREEIMAWCEAHAVDYVLGLAKNARLKRALSKELREAKQEHARTGAPARVFKDFTYKTRKSWSRRRRVVGKAEHLSGGPNPRFVVTSIAQEETDARALYEDVYCARGDMENRIKEQQLGLFADRTSTATMRANQIRLWLSSVAYVLLHALRRLALQGTVLARSQCDTIRRKLLKIGAQVRVTVRKIWVSLASGSPYAAIFEQTYHNLLAASLRC
jgi:Transposase DDE domain group 1